MNKIREGKTKLYIPETDLPEHGEVFYNPEMKLDRDISVALMKSLKPKDFKILDGLSATGVRALRYEKNISEGNRVWANDADKKAYGFIKKNKKINDSTIKLTNEDVNIILRKNKFDFIDIDPFGSPAPFLDSAARSAKKYLAVTATDTAALYGVYPEVSLRRYGIKSLSTDYKKEVGLRILISSIIKTFAKYDKAFVPVLSYGRKHYLRVLGETKKGSKQANKLLKEFDYFSHCFNCGWRKTGLIKICENCGSKTSFREVYMGKTKNNKLLENTIKNLKGRGYNILKELRDEPDFPFFYGTHYLSKIFKTSVPKIGYIVNDLGEKGYKANISHFSPSGIKTNAPFKKLLRYFKT